MDVNLSELQEMVMDREVACCDSCGRKESDTTERLNWALGDVIVPPSGVIVELQ